MAITATNIGSDLILVMDNGVGSSGQTLTKNRTYSSVKAIAINDDVYSVDQTLQCLAAAATRSASLPE